MLLRASLLALLAAVALVGSGCHLWWPLDARADAAVDHVAEVLAEAGREPARLPGAVRFECGPTDAVLGQRLSTDPITIDLAFADVASALDGVGRRLPPPPENPLAGVPASVDRWETTGKGWTVRWGESFAQETDDGRPATTITFVDGGRVSDEALRRWTDEETVVDLQFCG